jgi:O-acetyl-ADP-ribose deacetylase (regulator of RNase III)
MRDDGRLDFLLGDIAESDCDAIVNPCNDIYEMSHAGVNGALAAAAGPDYAAECAKLRPSVWNGDVLIPALVTGAGTLRARYVIHAVSPRWRSTALPKHLANQDRLAQDALRRVHKVVLQVAAERGCRSVALPAIGTGANHFPPEVAASIAVPTVEAFLQYNSTLERVVFVFQTRATLHDYLARSSTPNQHDLLIASLRNEISSHLRDAKRLHLAEMVDKVTDEATLRAILTEAHNPTHAAATDGSDNPASVGIRWRYVRAAESILQPGKYGQLHRRPNPA